MKKLRRFSVLLMIGASVFMTGCDASKIVETITKVADGIKQAIPAVKQVVDTFRGIFGNDNNNNTNTTTNNTNTAEADNANNNATAVVSDATDKEDLGQTDNNSATGTSVTASATAPVTQVATSTASANASATATAPASEVTVSAQGQSQMRNVVDYAMKNNTGASNGQCFKAVWGYLTSSGYGNLANWSDLPNMGSAEAKDFASYMNARKENLNEAGLQRLDTALNPPITNPHDPRIPEGAVIVVAAGSTGTAHPTAGDIVIKGNGRFINDGPNMYYGTRDTWQGRILGVYIPK